MRLGHFAGAVGISYRELCATRAVCACPRGTRSLHVAGMYVMCVCVLCVYTHIYVYSFYIYTKCI